MCIGFICVLTVLAYIVETRRLLKHGHQNPRRLLEAGVYLRPSVYWKFYGALFDKGDTVYHNIGIHPDKLWRGFGLSECFFVSSALLWLS